MRVRGVALHGCEILREELQCVFIGKNVGCDVGLTEVNQDGGVKGFGKPVGRNPYIVQPESAVCIACSQIGELFVERIGSNTGSIPVVCCVLDVGIGEEAGFDVPEVEVLDVVHVLGHKIWMEE